MIKAHVAVLATGSEKTHVTGVTVDQATGPVKTPEAGAAADIFMSQRTDQVTGAYTALDSFLKRPCMYFIPQ